MTKQLVEEYDERFVPIKRQIDTRIQEGWRIAALTNIGDCEVLVIYETEVEDEEN